MSAGIRAPRRLGQFPVQRGWGPRCRQSRASRPLTDVTSAARNALPDVAVAGQDRQDRASRNNPL
jgi:hypothetical protein